MIAHLSLLDQDRDSGVVASYRLMFSRFWRIVLGQLAVTALTALIALTVIGIPIAIRKYVDWQFVQQEIIFNNRSIREAMRESSNTVRGKWWWTVTVVAFFWVIGVAVGPILTFALIFANYSLIVVNLIASIVYAILVPYVASGRTLLYFDLEKRLAGRAPVPKRDWRRLWTRRVPSPQPG